MKTETIKIMQNTCSIFEQNVIHSFDQFLKNHKKCFFSQLDNVTTRDPNDNVRTLTTETHSPPHNEHLTRKNHNYNAVHTKIYQFEKSAPIGMPNLHFFDQVAVIGAERGIDTSHFEPSQNPPANPTPDRGRG